MFIQFFMNKKQRILLSTLELVVKQGFHATPMSQIAREANVAIGTIYHYFRNKEHIIDELYMMIYKDFGTVSLANIKDELPFKTKFEMLWLNLYTYFVSNPLAFQFAEFVGHPPLVSKETIEKTKPYNNEIVAFCLKGIELGIIRNTHIKLIIQMIYGNIISAVRLKERNELAMNDEQISQLIKMSWDSVRNIKD